MKKKPTILLICPGYDEAHRTVGSAPKIARQLAKHARVIVFTAASKNKIENHGKNLQVNYVKEWLIPDPVNNGILPQMRKKVSEVIEREKPDAVLSLKYMFYPNMLAIYLRRKGYRVVTATDAFPGFTWWSKSWLVNVVMWFWTRTVGRRILQKSNKVVLFHSGLKETAKKLKLNHVVIPNGVEPELVRKAKKKKLAGKLNILYVGRLESVKDYPTLLTAAKSFTQKHPEAHFYSVGDLIGKDDIVQEYKGKNFHFEGRKTLVEVYEYMKGADIIVLSSISEGLPNVIMEGMYCGCLAVSTPAGAVPEILENGKYGKLVPFKDPKAMEKVFEWALANPKERKEMATKGKERIKRDYNWDTLGKKYLAELCPEL